MSDETPKEPRKINVRVIGHKSEIEGVNANETNVHITFRPSGKDILKLIETCPKIKLIHVSPSHMRSISRSFKELLRLKGIELVEGNVWGHRSDIDVYAEIEVKK